MERDAAGNNEHDGCDDLQPRILMERGEDSHRKTYELNNVELHLAEVEVVAIPLPINRVYQQHIEQASC